VETRRTRPVPRHRITDQTATPQEEAGEHAEPEEVAAADAETEVDEEMEADHPLDKRFLATPAA
jgi:hypothetical protein